MKAAGYLRISKDTPDTTSPRRQREAITQLCAARGWDLVEMHEDVDISAFNGKHRPGFEAMMSRLADVDAVVFWRLDRLARSVRQLEDVADACERANVQMVSTDGEIDTTSSGGRAFFQMRGVFAELESRTLSERSRQMVAHKKSRDEWIGRVPYGWRVVDKHLEPDPEQQAVLVQAARRYAAGETFTAIAADLGFQTGPLSRMLHSERVQSALPTDVAGDLARALVERRGERTPTSRQSLLGGIAVCGVCGASLTLSSTRGGREGRWYSYRCGSAGHVGIAGPWLDEFVTTAVMEAVDTGRLVEAIKRRRKPKRSRKASEIEARIELIDEQLTAGKITPARYERMNSSLLTQLAAAQADERTDGVALPVEIARNLSERWDGLPTMTRRQIIAAVLERIEVAKATTRGPIEPERVTLTWRTS